MVNLLLESLTVTLTVHLFWFYFFLLTLVLVIQQLFIHWEIPIMWLSQFPLIFCPIQNGMPHFSAQRMTRDHLRDVLGTIFSNSVLLLLLVNFVSALRLELMYISLIVNIRSSLTYLHGFQLLLLLPQFVEIPLLFMQQGNSSGSKVKSIQASNRCKRVLKATNHNKETVYF